MSTKKRKSTYQRRCNKPLIKGKFYRVKDRNGGHIQSYIKRIRGRISIGLLDLQILMVDIDGYCFTK